MQSEDVQVFAFNLEANIFNLHQELLEKRWQPDPYQAFYIRDPKLRHIHKASVRDRVLYHAVFRVLYPIFDPLFIHDSYSCRRGKGTHAGVQQLERYLHKASENYTQPYYALKCDVKKFFDSIPHTTLLTLIQKRVDDVETIALIRQIVFSFQKTPGRGLPLGNVTSQLFANIYLNELDQFVKHRLKISYYLRYCDDFIILDSVPSNLIALIPIIRSFLFGYLQLTLHPKKLILRKVSTGIDFLGYVVLPHYRVVRTSTRKRIFRKLSIPSVVERKASVDSYIGITTHAKGYLIKQRILEICAQNSGGRGC